MLPNDFDAAAHLESYSEFRNVFSMTKIQSKDMWINGLIPIKIHNPLLLGVNIINALYKTNDYSKVKRTWDSTKCGKKIIERMKERKKKTNEWTENRNAEKMQQHKCSMRMRRRERWRGILIALSCASAFTLVDAIATSATVATVPMLSSIYLELFEFTGIHLAQWTST